MRRHRHSQLGNSEYLQKIVLFFLIGFFIGAVFYYFFQHSFEGIRKQDRKSTRLNSSHA